MKNKATFFLITAVILTGLTIFIRRPTTPPTIDLNKKFSVTTSFYPLYFFTNEIAGEYAAVYNITPAGAEPHDYEPTAQNLKQIESSRLLILNGGKLESWGEKIITDLSPQTTVLRVANQLADQTMIEDGEKITDPHVWLSPPLAKKEAAIIVQKLTSIDPSNTEKYQKNSLILEKKFDELDQEYRAGLSNCQKKDIITSHAAFGYLAREYGLKQIAISGLSPDEEPSPGQLTSIARFAKDNNIKYIFFESLVSPKFAETVAQEVGATTLVLNPIEGLTDTEIKDGKSYFTEMRNNLTNLKIALSCL